MRKLKVYLDTSVISHLDQQDAPEKMADTRRFWEQVKLGEYDAVLSDITLAEIGDCSEPKRGVLFEYLRQIPFTTIESNDVTAAIAERLIELGVLRRKSFDDCQHIAAAIVGGCDVIVSWNFKHIVNHKTMSGVKAVTALEGYNDLLIYTPTILIGGDVE